MYVKPVPATASLNFDNMIVKNSWLQCFKSNVIEALYYIKLKQDNKTKIKNKTKMS